MRALIATPSRRLRVKTGGGNAGHNGLRSIRAHVGNDSRRVRIGIGQPGDNALVHDFVLSDFSNSEVSWAEAVCRAVSDAAPLLIEGRDASFQNKTRRDRGNRLRRIDD